MSYARLAQRLYNCPLLITADKLEVIDHVFRAYDEGRAKLLSPYEKRERPELALPSAPQMTQSGYLRTAQGVAIMSILGTLVQRSGSMDAASGLTSYGDIGNQLATALSDPMVRGILLEIDSPGGEVNGIFDLAAEIRAAGAVKPVFAHANEQALSGGYVLASAAEAIYTPRTGMVGSIGVRMLHVDQSQYDAKRGLVYTDIVAGERKADGTPHAPLSDPARQLMQDHVDRTYAIFVDHVAQMRGINAQTVRDTQAGLLHADDATYIGLIDGVATINETMQLLLDRIAQSQTSIYGMRAHGSASHAAAPAALSTGDEDMLTETEKAAQAAAIAEARAAGLAEGKAAATNETATAAQTAAKAATETERKRVHAIQTCDAAKGKPALAAHLALETDMTVEQAQALLAKAAVETPDKPANALAGAMGQVPNPKIGADVSTNGEPKKITVTPAANVYAMRRKQAGHAA